MCAYFIICTAFPTPDNFMFVNNWLGRVKWDCNQKPALHLIYQVSLSNERIVSVLNWVSSFAQKCQYSGFSVQFFSIVFQRHKRANDIRLIRHSKAFFPSTNKGAGSSFSLSQNMLQNLKEWCDVWCVRGCVINSSPPPPPYPGV